MTVAGCSIGPVLGDYDVGPVGDSADAPWPKLVDAPAPVTPGVYSDATPNPITGLALEETLKAAAAEQAAEAERLSAPVIAPGAARRLKRAAR